MKAFLLTYLNEIANCLVIILSCFAYVPWIGLSMLGVAMVCLAGVFINLGSRLTLEDE